MFIIYIKKDINTDFIITKNNIEYNYCFIARKYDYMCGEEGKFYKPK